MNGDRFHGVCKLLDLTDAELARLLEIHDRRVRAFASGIEVIPEPVAIWLDAGVPVAAERQAWLSARPKGPFRTPRASVAEVL
jgi:hypothetical protein